MNFNRNMKEVVEQSFVQYTGAVLQSRALVDVRDCIKPSARQIFYCLTTDKFLPNKPFKKTLKAIGSVARMYIHGDASAEGVIMRASQPFAMRYPLVEVEGNNGNLMVTGNWAAPRYTSARLTEFTSQLFKDIEKNTIDDWRDNYDDTEKYPSVLPSKGFYNIVNGTTGIGIGAASSIPQFNIKDINHALEVLLLNPNCTFEEIYCVPDFATGGYLINEDEVKQALKFGSKKEAKANAEEGASCKLRAKWEYDKAENCIIITEIPYGVYTNTICKQLEGIIEDDTINPGIDRFNDLTGMNPNIKIYLKKSINPDMLMRALFQMTSLQYHYSINMTMLDQGRFPKVFTWKEALQSHIDHEKIVYRRGFEFDLDKIQNRLHILDGLLICMASIEEVIQTIKTSSSTADASKNLQNKFLLDEVQAKAVLDMKLARLANLEVEKLKKEKAELEAEASKIKDILNDETLFNNELIQEWRRISTKYGDEHRTKVIKVQEVKDTKEKEIVNVIPEDVVVVTTQTGYVKRIPTSAFKVSKRGAKGVKSQDDAILDMTRTNTVDYLMVFTNTGKMYRILVSNIPEGTNGVKGTPLETLIKLDKNEKVMAVSTLHRKSTPKYAIFITKNGTIKKTLLTEYTSTNRNTGIQAIKLVENDKLVNIIFMDEEELLLITKKGMSIRFNSTSINAIGRVATGVKGIKLKADDEVIAGMPIHKYTDSVALFTEDGIGKKVNLEEFPPQSKAGVGTICYKDATIVGAAMVSDEDNILVCGKNNIVVSAADIPVYGKSASGVIISKNNTIKSITKI